jgi:hypothetical protein
LLKHAKHATPHANTAGVDPSIKRKLDQQSSAITFRVVGLELLDKLKHEGRAPKILNKVT